MGKVFLDGIDGITEIKKIIKNGNKGVTKIIEATKKESLQLIIDKIDNKLVQKFESIYDNFDDSNPLENIEIKKQLIGKNKEIYSNFIDFCDYLIFKIKISKKLKDIKKIPLIISNLSSYKGKSGLNNIIKNKRSDVMDKYKKKIGKKKISLPKSNFIKYY